MFFSTPTNLISIQVQYIELCQGIEILNLSDPRRNATLSEQFSSIAHLLLARRRILNDTKLSNP